MDSNFVQVVRLFYPQMINKGQHGEIRLTNFEMGIYAELFLGAECNAVLCLGP